MNDGLGWIVRRERERPKGWGGDGMDMACENTLQYGRSHPKKEGFDTWVRSQPRQTPSFTVVTQRLRGREGSQEKETKYSLRSRMLLLSFLPPSTFYGTSSSFILFRLPYVERGGWRIYLFIINIRFHFSFFTDLITILIYYL